MATYVGGTTAGIDGTTGTNLTVSLTSLTGGIASSPSTGDVVIVGLATGSTTTVDLNLVTSGYNRLCNLYSSDTYDTNLFAFIKTMGSTPDTSVIAPPSGYSSDALTVVVHVWRPETNKKFIVSPFATYTGTNSGRPQFGGLTPTISGTIMVCIGASAYSSSANFTTSDLSNFLTTTYADTNDSMIGIGSYAWTSGSFSPATWGGGTTSTSASWASTMFGIYEITIETSKTLGEFLPSSSTKLYLRLNGNSYDHSEYNNYGTDTSITYSQANGKFGQGAGFDGSTSVIDLGTTTSLKPSSATLSLWAKYTSTGGGLFAKKSQNAGGYTAYGFEVNGSNISSRVRIASGSTFSDISTSGVTVNDGNWHNVILTFTSGSHKLYIDGVLRGSGTPSAGSIYYEADSKASVGNVWSGTWENPLSGAIDEVIIEDRVWSVSEVAKYYQMTRGMFGII